MEKKKIFGMDFLSYNKRRKRRGSDEDVFKNFNFARRAKNNIVIKLFDKYRKKQIKLTSQQKKLMSVMNVNPTKIHIQQFKHKVLSVFKGKVALESDNIQREGEALYQLLKELEQLIEGIHAIKVSKSQVRAVTRKYAEVLGFFDDLLQYILKGELLEVEIFGRTLKRRRNKRRMKRKRKVGLDENNNGDKEEEEEGEDNEYYQDGDDNDDDSRMDRYDRTIQKSIELMDMLNTTNL